MRHTPDQDLLLLAHRSLNPLKAIEARLHASRCAECRNRLAEFTALSATAAKALRVGMPAWKPMGLALKAKLAIGIVLVAALLLTGEIVAIIPHTNNTPPDVKGHMLEFCEPKDKKAEGSAITPLAAPKK